MASCKETGPTGVILARVGAWAVLRVNHQCLPEGVGSVDDGRGLNLWFEEKSHKYAVICIMCK